MLPTINLFGVLIPMYGVLVVIGIIVGLIIIMKFFAKHYNISKEDILHALIFGIIGAIVGSKLLYILTNVNVLIENVGNIWQILLSMVNGGFVFYGGLVGGVIGIFIYSKTYKVSFKELILLIVPAIPLMHAFGRIGCFCAGCCYGCEYNGFGAITFMNSLVAPNGEPFFPVQIIEAICNLIIFWILFMTYKKCVGTNTSIILYMILYSVTRFVLEYFRGDVVRGRFLWLYTSQWISLIIIGISLAYLFLSNLYKKQKNN